MTRPGLPETRQEARELVVLFCRRMIEAHLAYYTSGNLSTRIGGEPGLIAITPSSTPYDTLRPDDIVISTLDGTIVEGSLAPTSELGLHTLAYTDRPDVAGIAHVHSPAAMAMAAMGRELPPILHGFVGACGGGIVTAPYARGGTDEMAWFTAEPLRDRSACFLRNHGTLAVGPTLEHAYNAACVTEGAADAYLRALTHGPVPEIPADDVARIRARFWTPAWSGEASAPTHGG
jgi:L-fuculose-phosphate aldolase